MKKKKVERIKPIYSKIIIISIIILLIITNVVSFKLYYDLKYPSENKVIDNTGDEISRAKYFIKDWYNELSTSYFSSLQVYYNELRFNQGAYTLTVARDRIRAVYPRGVRYFQLNYIRYIEFYSIDGILQCRFYYNETGEYEFKLNL